MTKRYKICVCKTKSCTANFGRDTKAAFERLVERKGLGDRVVIGDGGCYGRCTKGPNVLIIGPIPDDQWKTFCESDLLPDLEKGPSSQMYNGVTANDAKELLEVHCEEGKVLERLSEKC